nr:hypothetical protein [Cressdnaviricota sp.]
MMAKSTFSKYLSWYLRTQYNAATKGPQFIAKLLGLPTLSSSAFSSHYRSRTRRRIPVSRVTKYVRFHGKKKKTVRRKKKNPRYSRTWSPSRFY